MTSTNAATCSTYNLIGLRDFTNHPSCTLPIRKISCLACSQSLHHGVSVPFRRSSRPQSSKPATGQVKLTRVFVGVLTLTKMISHSATYFFTSVLKKRLRPRHSLTCTVPSKNDLSPAETFMLPKESRSLTNHFVKTRLVDGEIVAVPGSNTGSADVHNIHLQREKLLHHQCIHCAHLLH